MITEISLPPLRCTVEEAATLLRISRAQMYRKIVTGQIHSQKDGNRQYITSEELRRYVESLEPPAVEVSG